MNPNKRGKMICGDARFLHKATASAAGKVRAIITSPPYLNTQDYGAQSQIGFGQSNREYFDDLRAVFQDCWDVATADATMWLVVGAVKRNGKLIQLPEMLTSLASEVGWIPREQITWEKGKSLPWARYGELRDVTEQVILLSKSEDFVFDLTSLSSPDPTSIWWRRYPERYSPMGRRPTNLWHIPIPTQGSWKRGPGHLCPFPDELTFRMISLTTDIGDLILDPFAGIGSVPAMAEAMGRKGVGIDITQGYVDQFAATRERTRQWFLRRAQDLDAQMARRKVFYQTIIGLRLLKYGSLLGKQMEANGFRVRRVHVVKSLSRPSAKYKIVSGVFNCLLTEPGRCDEVQRFLEESSRKRPLSKFGIEPSFRVTDLEESVVPMYYYEGGKFWEPPTRTRPCGNAWLLTADFVPPVESIAEKEKEGGRG